MGAFGTPDVSIEKTTTGPGQVEIQVMSGGQGTTVDYGERECSIQGRHQKLLEEAPTSAVSDELRERMGAAAIERAAAVNYVGAGTVEFLLDADGSFYFMEMNTRIQVEHPVTEEVYGVDLIEQQIRVAMGERLENHAARINGHAIECRINAENPDRNFSPSPGRISAFNLPGGLGVRVDTHAYADYTIPANYDSMIAKLIVHGNTRQQAIGRMQRALDEFVIEGVATTIPFHRKLLRHPAFLEGAVDTHFVEQSDWTSMAA